MRVVLVGLSGAGKSRVGRLLASRLEWPFLDLDDEVERRTGLTIEDIFRREGEESFRLREAQVTRQAEVATPAVIAAGGGWMARPELRERWPDAVRVWLDVKPETALARLGAERARRPLLEEADPLAALETMLSSRLPHYTLAEYRVATDGLEPEEVVDEILSLLPEWRTKGAT